METLQNHWQEWNIRGFAVYHVFYNFHSDIIQIAAERGLLTLSAWLWFVGAYLHYLFRLVLRSRGKDQFATGVVVGILGGFIAFLLMSFVLSVLYDDSPVMLLFFCFGVAVAIERILASPEGFDLKQIP